MGMMQTGCRRRPALLSTRQRQPWMQGIARLNAAAGTWERRSSRNQGVKIQHGSRQHPRAYSGTQDGKQCDYWTGLFDRACTSFMLLTAGMCYLAAG